MIFYPVSFVFFLLFFCFISGISVHNDHWYEVKNVHFEDTANLPKIIWCTLYVVSQNFGSQNAGRLDVKMGLYMKRPMSIFLRKNLKKNLYLKFRSDDTLIHKEWRLSNYICPALYKLLGWADKKEEACVQLYFRLTTCDFTLTLLKPITYTYILVIVMQYL